MVSVGPRGCLVCWGPVGFGFRLWLGASRGPRADPAPEPECVRAGARHVLTDLGVVDSTCGGRVAWRMPCRATEYK